MIVTCPHCGKEHEVSEVDTGPKAACLPPPSPIEMFARALMRTVQQPRWEDEDHGTDKIEELRQLFRKRLYGEKDG